MASKLRVADLGLRSYADVHKLMTDLRAAKTFSSHQLPQWLLLCEHPPTYTLGRSSKNEHVKFDLQHPPKEFEVCRVDRGGDVTYHCPGQLVAYPLLDLRVAPLKSDLRWYVRSLEEVIVRVLDRVSDGRVHGSRHPEHPGVWVGNAKVAAVGMACRSWITWHGTALNVSCDMSGFDRIIPCGISEEGLTVTKVNDLIQKEMTVEAMKPIFVSEFQKVFNFEETDFDFVDEDMDILKQFETAEL